MSLDVRLPPLYRDWHDLFEAEDRTLRAAGVKTRHVIVRHRELIGFLKRIQLRPTYEALQTYAAYVGRKEMEDEVLAVERLLQRARRKRQAPPAG